MSPGRRWTVLLVLPLAVGAGCTTADKDEASAVIASERINVGATVVEVQQRDDGRFQACLVSAAEVALPDGPVCVGPHDGRTGPGQSWSRADRFGADTVFLAILGHTDSIVDSRFTVASSASFPVAVAAGVLPDFGEGVVCTVYESGGTRYRYNTGVSATGAPGAGVSTDRVSCAP